MKTGLAFPTTEIGNDPVIIKDFAQAVEDMGYGHLTFIDHVVQQPAAAADDWRAYYTLDNPFHEPVVMMAYVAGATRRIELASAIIILPQRQTVLVAKQLAELDVVANGRLRAGFGVGWNEVEFEALGQPFEGRGERFEEQIEVLRALWSREVVSFEGQWHRIRNAGLNPRPVQRPIPIWLGAFAPVAIRRAGRLADGLFLNPRKAPGSGIEADIEALERSLAKAGRTRGDVQLDATLHHGGRSLEALGAEVEAWRGLGVDYLTVRTLYSELDGIDAHLAALESVRGLF